METSIRYVRLRGQSLKPVLCFRGRNQAHVVVNDTNVIRVVSNIPLEDHDKAGIVMGPSGFGKVEYPIKLFCERFERMGATKGITKRAQFLLEKAKNGGVEDDAVLPPDELVNPPDPGTLRTVPDAPTLSEIATAKPVPAARKPVGGAKPATGSAPKPDKPARSSSGNRSAPVAGSRTAGADIVRKLASELKLEPTKLRKLLRSKGLRAPYTDEKLIRSKLK